MKNKSKNLTQIINEISRTGICDSIADSISIQDRDFNILYQNKASITLYGQHKGELCFEFYQEKNKYCEDCPLIPVFKNGNIHTAEKALSLKKDIMYFEIKASALRDSEGKIIGGIEVSRDITERKKAEEKLISEKEKAQKYFDIAEVMLVVIGADQNVLKINNKGCEILEYEEDEIIGKNWFDHFLHKSIKDAVKMVYDQLMSGEIEFVKHNENSILTSSGEEKIINWHNTILTDNEGKITGTLSSGEDITAHRKMEEELKRRIKELEQFYNLAVGRELKMKQLKEKVKELQSDPSRYKK